MDATPSKTVPFGYREVPEDLKPRLVRDVFSSVARRYDLMNDLMSAGIHRLWKGRLVDWLNPQPGTVILDVAGGTGDVALRIARRVAQRSGDAAVTVCDINPDMLAMGSKRAAAVGVALSWLCADAEALPLPDAHADAYTIAFGIRNTTHMDKVLSEAFRVLKPGGRFICLEFSRPLAPLLDDLYDAYSFSVLPRMGELVAGDGAAYRYLAESIRRFPPQDAFARVVTRAGFGRVSVRNLAGGVAAMHSGWKL